MGLLPTKNIQTTTRNVNFTIPATIYKGLYGSPSLVTGPSKRGNKKAMLFLNRGPGETEFKTVGNPL